MNADITLALIGTTEIMIICGVCVLLFGAKKIPQLAKGMGEALKEFKNAAREGEELKEDVRDLGRDVKSTVARAVTPQLPCAIDRELVRREEAAQEAAHGST